MAYKPVPADKKSNRGRKLGVKNCESPYEKKFIEEYLKGYSQFEAAVRAGYTPGCARHQAARLLALPRVLEAIAAGRRELMRETGISGPVIVQELWKIYLACCEDLTVKGAIAGAIKCLELIDRAGPRILVETKQVNVKHEGPAPVFVVVWEGEDAEIPPALPEGRVAEYQPEKVPGTNGVSWPPSSNGNGRHAPGNGH